VPIKPKLIEKLITLDPRMPKDTHTSPELHALTEIAKTITSPLELPELLSAIMDKLIGVLEPAETGAVMLWDNASGYFRPAAAFGYNQEIFQVIRMRAGEGITGKVFTENRARLLNTAKEIAAAMDNIHPDNLAVIVQSLGEDKLPICTLAAPISVDGQQFGVLLLETFDGPGVFTTADIPFVQSLADLIAMSIDRARLSAKADSIREARESERMRSELMAALSHELRLPLTAIKGYTTALLMDEVVWDRKKSLEFLKLIDAECDNMQVLLSDILDSALTDVNQLSIEAKPVRLHRIAREIVSEMQTQTDLHRLVVDLPVDFPIVSVDPHWIRQVFRNILDNAIKYAPEGGLIVIRGETRIKDVVVSIADQGMGISPENLIPLFEKYFRIIPSDDYHVPGSGLGLPISRAIVEAHGGRIWIESKEGQGTTVNFSLERFDLPEEV
jgi:K+-sensing histidine kinase KdpD